MAIYQPIDHIEIMAHMFEAPPILGFLELSVSAKRTDLTVK